MRDKERRFCKDIVAFIETMVKSADGACYDSPHFGIILTTLAHDVGALVEQYDGSVEAAERDCFSPRVSGYADRKAALTPKQEAALAMMKKLGAVAVTVNLGKRSYTQDNVRNSAEVGEIVLDHFDGKRLERLIHLRRRLNNHAEDVAVKCTCSSVEKRKAAERRYIQIIKLRDRVVNEMQKLEAEIYS